MHARIVAAAEAFAVVIAHSTIHMGMAVLFVIGRVGATVMIEIPARSLNAIMETLPLHVAELRRRLIPSSPDMYGDLRRCRSGIRW